MAKEELDPEHLRICDAMEDNIDYLYVGKQLGRARRCEEMFDTSPKTSTVGPSKNLLQTRGGLLPVVDMPRHSFGVRNGDTHLERTLIA